MLLWWWLRVLRVWLLMRALPWWISRVSSRACLDIRLGIRLDIRLSIRLSIRLGILGILGIHLALDSLDLDRVGMVLVASPVVSQEVSPVLSLLRLLFIARRWPLAPPRMSTLTMSIFSLSLFKFHVI
jgi:hypothetical protein